MREANHESADARTHQPARNARFYREQRHTETVVFVHGILGNYVGTWGRFPALLSDDLDLPELDILLWGYSTGWIRRHHDLTTEGQHLVTALELLIRPEQQIVVVGHSMGGLIILRGLADRMSGGHAQEVPCRQICWITLFASPLNGVWAAALAYSVFYPLLRLTGTLFKHLRDLSEGGFCDELLVDVRARIYKPALEDAENKRIPIRVVAASRDIAVDPVNRSALLAPYDSPAALQLDQNHTDIKLPEHVADLRYRALVSDLQLVLARRFQSLCAQAIDANATEDDRYVALLELQRRYSKIVLTRIRDVVARVERFEEAKDEFLLLMAIEGARSGEPPFAVANRAMMVLAARHRDWR